MNCHFYSKYLAHENKWPTGYNFLHLLKQKLKGQTVFKIVILAVIFSSFTLQSWAQAKKITGNVHDELGAPVIGATLRIKGGNGGTATDVNGKYTLNAGKGATLIVSAIGYETVELIVRDGEKIDVGLKSKDNSLSEVVVTALGIKREKRELTYSVQQVSGEQLTASKEPGVLNSLDGKVAGVQITSSTGAPGSSSRIVIRGNTSLTGNNEALIILDGVPINNSETGGSTSGSGGISRISDIDPATIESINVLKGSAASALYGSSAARGVVIITTKGGQANTAPKVNLNSQFSFENPILPKLNSKYALGDRGVYFDGSPSQQTSAVWGPPIADLEAQGKLTYNHNPLTDFFVTGHTYTNTASVTGGTERTGYFMSFSNLAQDGTVPTTKYGRNTFFAKFSNKLSDNLTANFQVNYTVSSDHSIPQGYDVNDPLWTLFTAPYTYNFLPYLDASGNQRVFRPSRNNPYWSLYNDYNDEKITRVIPTFSLIYNPVKWITVTERFGVDTYSEQNNYYETPSVPLATVGLISQNSANFHQYNNDLIIEGRKTFGNYNVSLLLGSNIQDTYSQSHNLQGSGTSIIGYNNVANGATLTSLSGSTYNEKRKIGFYAQSNIGYKSYLNLALTGRYDGSSVLSLDNYFYPYGSASLGFLFADLLKIPALSFGKLRVSVSAVGNDNVQAYANNTSFGKATNFPYNSVSGFLYSSTLGNPLLKNENTSEEEVGLELNLLKNRISFEGSYFYRNGTNLLTTVTLGPSSGYGFTNLNAASMTNKGFEALLNISPFKGKKFSWDINFNWTKINNKVTSIYAGLSQLANNQTVLMVGQPYGVIYNIGYQRNAAGQILIDDKGLPLASTSNEIIGNIQPNYQAGMTNNFRYGNFTLGFFLDFKNGGQIMNSDERYGFFYGTPKVTEDRADRVVPGIVASTGQPNTKVVAAEDYYQRLNLNYEAAVQDATFLKLRYASLGYNLPQSMLKKLPFGSASFTITGRNLFIYKPYFTGSDPEVSSLGSSNGATGTYGSTVPTSRSINFALNVTFK